MRVRLPLKSNGLDFDWNRMSNNTHYIYLYWEVPTLFTIGVFNVYPITINILQLLIHITDIPIMLIRNVFKKRCHRHFLYSVHD